jgi:hypothetical protein
MTKRRRPSPRRPTTGLAVVFGALAALSLVGAALSYSDSAAKRTEGMYLQEHGLLAIAEIDSHFQKPHGKYYDHGIRYHFTDLTGAQQSGQAAFPNYDAAHAEEQPKLYYLPEDPDRQMLVSQIPSLWQVLVAPLFFVLAGLFFGSLAYRYYHRERKNR